MLITVCLLIGIIITIGLLAHRIFTLSFRLNDKIDGKFWLNLTPLILGYVCLLWLSTNIKSMDDKITMQRALLSRTLSFMTSPAPTGTSNEEFDQAFNEEFDELVEVLKRTTK